MPNVIIPPKWNISESQVTSESAYIGRRDFIKTMGLASIGAAAVLSGCSKSGWTEDGVVRDPLKPARIDSPFSDRYPAMRNPKYTVEREATSERWTATYNNFYEFSTDKERIWRMTDKFKPFPWQVEVSGHVENPGVYDVDDLIRPLELEERLYRLRCVEAWAAVVPWTGAPLSDLITRLGPTNRATHIRFQSFHKPFQAPGFRNRYYPWPFSEGLTMEEAMNEVTLLCTGMYGHELLKQNGAPLRIITPWKYGYKSIKSITKIEFIDHEPETFWHSLVPREYSFTSNVNPTLPHPRWSQASERDVETGDRRRTLPYNGYGEFVAHMYAG